MVVTFKNMSRILFDTKVMPATEKMYRYAMSILKDRETAEDVVQDCLAKIWKNRKKLPEIQNIDSWVMRITRNQCYDWVKVNRFSVTSDREIDEYNNRNTDHFTADGQMLLKDRLKWLNRILETLPQKQKEIYYLREVEEMTYQDIAEILSLSLGEVKIALYRTRQKIQAAMQKIEAYGLAN